MEQLLVKRAPLSLSKTEGTVEEIKKLPGFLRKSPLTVGPLYLEFDNVCATGDIRKTMFLSSSKEDKSVIEKLYDVMGIRGVFAYWSGYRSCIVPDEKANKLYRLKGIAFGDRIKAEEYDDHIRVEGGQFLQNANYERIYSNKFNKVLKEEGMEPVMEYVGLYKYSFRVKRRKLAASIIKVLGDTRLDELFYSIELLHKEVEKYGDKTEFLRLALLLYYDLGFAAGALKRLMDKSGQSWSDNPERTNAHLGNMVVYRKDEKHLGLGFVDFDASCDSRDMSKLELRKQQKFEMNNILGSLYFHNISFRSLEPHHFKKLKKAIKESADTKYLRDMFGGAFLAAYDGVDHYSSRDGIQIKARSFDGLSKIIKEAARRSLEENPHDSRYGFGKDIASAIDAIDHTIIPGY